jgi:hypothetical protein
MQLKCLFFVSNLLNFVASKSVITRIFDLLNR